MIEDEGGFVKEGVRPMAKPIEATPILYGEDAKRILRDLDKPDLGKARRAWALELLRRATDRK